MAMNVVQSVAASANQQGSVSVTLASTGAGNLLLVYVECSNPTVTLTPSTTGSTQTFNSIANPKPGGGQAQAWYVKNCASGTTGITVTRNTGVGQFSLIVMEVSGVDTASPLDQSASSTTQGDSGTTGTTTQASEFWWVGFSADSANSDGTSPSFSGLSAGWTPDKETESSQGGANSNTGAYDAYQIVSATGAANATITITNAASVNCKGIIATFKASLTPAPNVSDTTAVTDTPTILIPKLVPSVSDTTAMTDTPTIALPGTARQVSVSDTTTMSEANTMGLAWQVITADATVVRDYRENLVLNPSFENDNLGWGLDNDFTRSSAQVFSGAVSVQQISTLNFANFTTANDAVGLAVQPYATYTFSFYYLLTINSGFAPIWQINTGSAFGTQIAGAALSAAAVWTRVTVTFNVGNNNKIYFRLFNNNGNAQAYYDAFQLEAGDAATPYFDGSKPGAVWEGTANFSASITGDPNTISYAGVGALSINKSETTNMSDAVFMNTAITLRPSVADATVVQDFRENLFLNPSFEADTTGWDLDADFTRVTSDSFSGAASVQQISAANFANFVIANGDGIGLAVVPFAQYTLSFYYKMTVNSGLAPNWEVNQTSAFGANLAAGGLSAQASWTRQTITFNSGNNTKIWLRIYNNNGNVIGFYDAFQLEAGAAATSYFDGHTPGAKWEGTPDYSQSLISDTLTLNQTASGTLFINKSETTTMTDLIGASASTVLVLAGGALAGLLFRSIDAMKITKDNVTGQPNDTYITRYCQFLVANFNITHIANSTPIDIQADWVAAGSTPSPRTITAYLQAWADGIHNVGLKVIWRNTFCGLEGLYGFTHKVGAGNTFPLGTAASAATDGQTTYLGKIYAFIVNNTSLFRAGDIFAFIPEGTNGIFSEPTSWVPYSGAGAQANYQQIMVDLKSVCDQALAAAQINGVYSDYNTNNFSEINSGWLPSAIYSTQQSITMDHYGITHAVSEMQSDYNTALSRGSPYSIFHQEWSDYWDDPGSITNPNRITYLQNMYAMMGTFVPTGKLYGFNYWGGWDMTKGSYESILSVLGGDSNPTFGLLFNAIPLQQAFANGLIDTTQMSDAVSIIIASGPNKSDTTTMSDSVQVILVDTLNKSDTTAITEAVSFNLPNSPSASDTTVVFEGNIGISVLDFPQPSDTSAISELLAFQVFAPVIVSDTTAMSDVPNISIGGTPSATDTTTMSELQQFQMVSFPNKSDTTAISELQQIQIVGFPNVNDATAMSDATTVVLAYQAVQVSDTSPVSDVVNFLAFGAASVADTTPITELITIKISVGNIYSDTTAMSELVQLSMQNFVLAADTTAISELNQFQVHIPLLVSDTTVIGENINFGISILKINLSETTVMQDVVATSEKTHVLLYYILQEDINFNISLKP